MNLFNARSAMWWVQKKNGAGWAGSRRVAGTKSLYNLCNLCEIEPASHLLTVFWASIHWPWFIIWSRYLSANWSCLLPTKLTTLRADCHFSVTNFTDIRCHFIFLDLSPIRPASKRIKTHNCKVVWTHRAWVFKATQLAVRKTEVYGGHTLNMLASKSWSSRCWPWIDRHKEHKVRSMKEGNVFVSFLY